MWDVVRGDAIRGARVAEPTILALLSRLATGMASPLNASDVGLRDNHETNARIDDLIVNFSPGYGRGILATRGVHDLSGPIWATPARAVAWLLDHS